MKDKELGGKGSGGKRAGAGRPHSRLVLRTGQMVDIIFSAAGEYRVGSGRVDVVDVSRILVSGVGWNLQIITDANDSPT